METFVRTGESSYPEVECVLRGLDLCRRLCPTLLAPICRRQSAFRTGGFGGHEVEVSSIEMQEFVHTTTSFYRINANVPCCIYPSIQPLAPLFQLSCRKRIYDISIGEFLRESSPALYARCRHLSRVCIGNILPLLYRRPFPYFSL